MVVFCEGTPDITWHGYIDVSFFIIPGEVHATVEFTFPIDCDFVIGAEGGEQVVSVGLGEVLDSEVVNAECGSHAATVLECVSWDGIRMVLAFLQVG